MDGNCQKMGLNALAVLIIFTSTYTGGIISCVLETVGKPVIKVIGLPRLQAQLTY